VPIIEVVLEAGSGCGGDDGAWCATIEAAEAAVDGGCFKRRNSSSTCLPSSVGRRAAA
jgi:hypothetical protein